MYLQIPVRYRLEQCLCIRLSGENWYNKMQYMVGNLIIREQNDTGRLEKNVQKTDDRTKKFCLVQRVGKDILYQKI